MVNLNLSLKDCELTEEERQFLDQEVLDLEKYLDKINKSFKLDIHIQKVKSKVECYKVKFGCFFGKRIVVKAKGCDLKSVLDNMFEDLKRRLVRNRDKKKSKFIKKAINLKKKILDKYIKN